MVQESQTNRLKHLHSIKNLTILLLNDTDVSDDGTTTLALLPRLEWLYLNRTKVDGYIDEKTRQSTRS